MTYEFVEEMKENWDWNDIKGEYVSSANRYVSYDEPWRGHGYGVFKVNNNISFGVFERGRIVSPEEEKFVIIDFQSFDLRKGHYPVNYRLESGRIVPLKIIHPLINK